MKELNPCPRCGSEIAADAPQGLCPKCLMANAIETDSPEPQYVPTVTADPKATRPSRVNLGSLEGDIPAALEPEGKYSILSEYGKGGMGRVLLVHDEHLGRDIALKELLPDLGDGSTPTPARHSKEMAARFLREAKVTGQLEHPSITPVHEIGRKADGTLYYTMKLVRGRTLSQAIKVAKDFEERLKLLPHFVDLCNAIAYAHSRGVIHRDIKPSNVMIGDYGETVIIDWGLAKVKSARDASDPPSTPGQKTILGMRTNTKLDDDSGKTQHGQAMGTPAYMPPEQAAGDLDNIDERSDIYSLGTVLFEILTGQPPVEGKSVAEILRNVIAGKLKKVRALEPKCQKDLAAIVEKVMALEPERRYQSAMELGETVQKWKPKGKRSRRVVIAEVIALLLLITIPMAIAVLNHLTHIAVEKKIATMTENGLFSEHLTSRAPVDSGDINEAANDAVSPQDKLIALWYSEPRRSWSNPSLMDLYLSEGEFSPALTAQERDQALNLLVADLSRTAPLVQKLKDVAEMPPATTAQLDRALTGSIYIPSVELLLAEGYLALLDGNQEIYLEHLALWVKLFQHIADIPGLNHVAGANNSAHQMRHYTTLFYNDDLLSPDSALRAFSQIEPLLNQKLPSTNLSESFLRHYRAIEDGQLNRTLRELNIFPDDITGHLQVQVLGSPFIPFVRRLDMLRLLDFLALMNNSELLPYTHYRKQVFPQMDALNNSPRLRPMTNYCIRYHKELYYDILFPFSHHRAQLDLDRILIALAVFKNARGTYPQHLGELSPAYLEQVPADPFGDAYIYRPEGDSFKLYSVGPNGEDDRGVSLALGPDDIGVSQPPAEPAK